MSWIAFAQLAMAGGFGAIVWMMSAQEAMAGAPTSARSAGVSFDGQTYTNRLIDSHDPYLLLHAHNPVDWYPWGPEAIEAARRENKPIFVSFGYSTCFWCHVAERELYSNPEVAKLMNQWFINVKVDREERPDIDRIYMRATQILTGKGGWPNNVFLTPDLKPFFAGSYFPLEDRDGRTGFKHVLESMHKAWAEDRSKVMADAENVYRTMKREEGNLRAKRSTSLAPRQWMDQAVASAARRFDESDGGFSGESAQKFPQWPLLSALLDGRAAGKSQALDMAVVTLKNMAAGGIMDQLAGGFHRYSTDLTWSIPHFEKMLYDNAQALNLYAQAYAVTKQPIFRHVALRTARFMIAEMRSPEGGFYSALDADVEGVEGASYVWTHRQIEDLLGIADTSRFTALYTLGPMPASVHGQRQVAGGILRVDSKHTSLLTDHGQLVLAVEALQPLRDKLLAERNNRHQPARDAKIVVSTNALAVMAFAQAGHGLKDRALSRVALQTAEWLWRNAFDPRTGELKHQFFAGHSGESGFLDDYALLGQAFLTLHRRTGDKAWLSRARQVTDAMLQRFSGPTGALADSPNRTGLLLTPPSDGDLAQPSGQSAAIALLLELSGSAGNYNSRYAVNARQALTALAGQVSSQPYYWGALLAALNRPELMSALDKAAEPQLPKTMPKEIRDSADLARVSACLLTGQHGTDLVATIDVAPGYHINANPASYAGLIPTELTVPGYPDLHVDYPSGQPFKAPFAPRGISVYQGRIRLLGKVPSALIPSIGEASLRLQACNDETCFPPATIPLTVEPKCS